MHPSQRLARLALLLAAATGSLTAPALAQRAAKPAERAVWPDEGPRTWAPRPTVADITANDLRTRLYGIADDSMLGRRIGEPSNYKTTEYIAREFKRLGLTPAGDNGTWFQELPFGPIGFDSVASRLSLGGAALAIKANWIPLAPSLLNGVGPRADFSGVATVFAGAWGDTTVVLDPAVFAGKIAVYVGAPGVAAGGPRPPALPARCDSLPDRFGAAAAIKVEAALAASNASLPPRPPTPVMRDRRAIAAGAAGVLFVALDNMTPAQVNAAVAPRMTMQPATPANVGAPGGATISRAIAARLFDQPLEQLAVGTMGVAVSASWSYDWRPTTAPARNVIAILPGSDPALAGEYVLVGAHNDHVGTAAAGLDHDSVRAVNTVTRRQGANDPACRPTPEQQHRIDSLIAYARGIRPPRRDSIFNGADDDGSGTVVMLEIAEKFASEKPARSIIFISHQGEEAGLLGSRWFTDHPTIPLGQVVAAHNMDMLGKGRADQVKFGGPNSVQTLGARRLSREFGDIIDSVNAVRAEPMAIDKSWDVTANPMNRFCRSDQVNYVRTNVPVTYFSLGYAQDYHQLTDEPQYIDYDHAARLGRFIHDVMMAIAMRRDRPAIAGADLSYPQCFR